MDSYPLVFEAKGTDNNIDSFVMASISVRLSIGLYHHPDFVLYCRQAKVLDILIKVLVLDSMAVKRVVKIIYNSILYLPLST